MKPTMEVLAKIFGSEAKVRILRLFLFNPSETYDITDVSRRTKVKRAEAKREIENLDVVGLVRRRRFVKEARSNGKKRLKSLTFFKKKVTGWLLNEKFIYLNELRNLLINTILLRESDIVSRLARAGKLKLVVVSGVFLEQWDSRVDLLVVGDRLKMGVIEGVMRRIEAEIGRELKYSVLETQDFQYRLAMYDKLVRDVFDYPHRKVLDKLGIKLAA